MTTAQIHRFGDCVALYVGTGQTIYITPKEAKAIAKQLNACAKDIAEHSFGKGTFKTYQIEFSYTGHNGCDYKHKRKDKSEV